MKAKTTRRNSRSLVLAGVSALLATSFLTVAASAQPAPVFTIDNVTQNETNFGTTSFVFTVTKTGSTALSSSVDYQTMNGTATAGSDYTAIPATTLNFGPTDTTMQVTVLVNGDAGFEPNETFFVNLSEAVNATISDPQGAGTILNDDTPTGPAITINDVTIAEGNTGTRFLTFTITLFRPSVSGAISVDFATADDSATVANNDYVARVGTIIFPPGGAGTFFLNVMVTVNGDAVFEPNETFFVNLSNATGGATIVDPQGLGTITNDDVHVAPVVSNTDDSGVNSLRQALLDSLDGDTIIFNLPAGPHTITLASELPITTDVVVNGPVNGALTVSGAGVARVFNVNAATTVTLSKMTIANGNAGFGGAIQNNGDLTINNCTLSGNTATGSGGAMNNDGTMKITNSTLSGNTAGNEGGAIFIGSGGTLALGNVTLVKNSALGGAGGGIASLGTLNLKNSIVALNTAVFGNNVFNIGGTATSSGYNLSNDDGGGFLTSPGDQVNTDPILGPLKNNGGLSFTHAPLSNSPANDTGKDLGADGNPTEQDQRGSVRPVTYDAAITPPAGGDRSDIGAVELPPGVIPTGAISRKTHGGAGTFDINLPLTGVVGVECRSGGVTNDYQVVVTFASPVTFSSAAVNDGTGSVGSATGNGTTTVTLNLTGVTNAQRITLALFGVDNTVNSGDVGVRMGVLIGDTNNSGGVTAADVAQTKAQSGQAATGSNFRTDVNASGSVSAADVALVKSKSGTTLPP